jgi:hypothetical protein
MPLSTSILYEIPLLYELPQDKCSQRRRHVIGSEERAGRVEMGSIVPENLMHETPSNLGRSDLHHEDH